MADSMDSFAAMFEQEAQPETRVGSLNVGDAIEGVVAHVGTGEVIIELDQKRQGYVPLFELVGEKQEVPPPNVGDVLKLFVVEIDSTGQIKLGKGFGKGGGGAAQLELARDAGIPVSGKVLSVNKGGVEVDVSGARAFCPMSQLDVHYVEDPAQYINQTLTFQVVELKERGGAVLSRRMVLEAEQAKDREALMGRLSVGATIKGRVSETRDFGAFVDLGGATGLIPRSEVSHERVAVTDAVSTGDIVEVQVKAIAEEKGKLRITLSLKSLSADPWEGIETVIKPMQVVAGLVTRTAEFGAFVRLGSGIEGLLHRSEFEGDAVPEVGAQMVCVVKTVEPARKRIGLALAQPGDAVGGIAKGLSIAPGAIVQAHVEKVERFGVFVQIEGTKGRAGRGLIPSAELGVERGVDLRKHFPAGQEVRAKVLEVGDGRLRLSISAAVRDAERAVFDGYRKDHAPPNSMGTLGELLKKKISS